MLSKVLLPIIQSVIFLMGIQAKKEWTYWKPPCLQNSYQILDVTRWSVGFPACKESGWQSPININTAEVEENASLRPLRFLDFNKYLSKPVHLINNGHSVVVQPSKESSRPVIIGPSSTRFKFESLHFHWGYSYGSEHLIDSQVFPMEMHLIHIGLNFSSVQEALKAKSVAVVAVFFQISLRSNPGLASIQEGFKRVIYRNDSTVLRGNLRLEDLIPRDRRYFTYEGSLTTPPCDEGIEWIVLRQPIGVSNEQLEAFRDLKAYGRDATCNQNMFNNFRPVMPLNGREVYVPKE